jgi:hypothetical protein
MCIIIVVLNYVLYCVLLSEGLCPVHGVHRSSTIGALSCGRPATRLRFFVGSVKYCIHEPQDVVDRLHPSSLFNHKEKGTSTCTIFYWTEGNAFSIVNHAFNSHGHVPYNYMEKSVSNYHIHVIIR